MILYLVRLLSGYSIEPQAVIIGVAATFLVSYAGTGFYVWYILRMAENELDQPAAKPERRLDAAGSHEKPLKGGPDAAEVEELP